MRAGLVSLIVAALFFFALILSALLRDPRYESVSASLTPSLAASATSPPTSTSSPVPTIDQLATTSASSASTSIAADTQRASTQIAIANETSSALEREAFAALARERDDAHAIALAQIAELEAKKRVVELTFEPTTVSIARTEDARELARKKDREKLEDAAHWELLQAQTQDAKNVSTAQTVGMIALVAGLPITLVICLFMLARAQAQKIRAERDRALAEIEHKNYERASLNYEAQLEHDLQMSRAEILNRRDLVDVISKEGISTLDGRMTRDRLLAFVTAAVLADGASATVLTPSSSPIWNDDDVRISHREWSACATELERLRWIETPQRGKPTKLTEGATLGDLLSVLQRSNQESAPPAEVEEALTA